MAIKLWQIDGKSHDDRGLYKDWTFPAGEIGFQVGSGELFNQRFGDKSKPVYLMITNGTGDAIMELLMANDALKRSGFERIHLVMGYVPYGRQDRVTTPGTAFSLEVFASLLNSCNFDQVYLIDPHSPVTGKLINNKSIITLRVHEVFEFFPTHLLPCLSEELIIVAPDKGAVDRAKSAAVALKVPSDHIAYAHKERDPRNGNLKIVDMDGYEIKPDDHILVVDDICDGGATFIQLAQFLRDNQGVKPKPSLYVSHGIFSKGFKDLDYSYRAIYTTDSFYLPGRKDSNGVELFTPAHLKIPLRLVLEKYEQRVNAVTALFPYPPRHHPV